MRQDLIVIGGGIKDAALAYTLASSGAKVLVLGREIAFRHRVRGEQLHCWGGLPKHAPWASMTCSVAMSGMKCAYGRPISAACQRRHHAISSEPRHTACRCSTSTTPRCKP